MIIVLLLFEFFFVCQAKFALKYIPFNPSNNLNRKYVQTYTDIPPNLQDRLFCFTSEGNEIWLCGVTHISQKSSDIVEDFILRIKPDFIVLELCLARAGEVLQFNNSTSISLSEIVRQIFKTRSIKLFGLSLLHLIQSKLSASIKANVGNEQLTAVLASKTIGSTIFLGDRSGEVTIQRIIDVSSFFERFKLLCYLCYEATYISIFQNKFMQRYLTFVDDINIAATSIKQLEKHFPSAAKVLIDERNKYMTEILFKVADFGNKKNRTNKIFGVFGMGHLNGMKLLILENQRISMANFRGLTTSSIHLPTWDSEYLTAVEFFNIDS